MLSIRFLRAAGAAEHCAAIKKLFKVFDQETVPSVDKGQHGFSGHLERLAALSSLPGVSLGPREQASADLAV